MTERKKPKPAAAARREARVPLAWRPHATTEKFDGERTEKLLSDLRVENAREAAAECAACAALQQKTGDASALCRPHLQKALGL